MKTLWKRLRQYAGGAPSTFEPLTLTDPATITGFKEISHQLRAQKPVCPVSGGGVLLLDPDDVRTAFSNRHLTNEPSRFSALAAKNKDRHTAASVAFNILPFLDGPKHIVLRKWASQAFFTQLRAFDAQIADIADRHCQNLDADKTYLLVEDIARRFVVDTIGRFIGVNLDPADMKSCTSSLFRLFAPAYDAETFAKTNEGLDHARMLLTRALNDRRADQTDCLINTLDASFPADLDDVERDLVIIDTALLFLADGVENVEAAIGVVMMQHAEFGTPITPDFVRQAIRADTPGQTIARIASQDMTIADAQLKAGTPVFLSLSSANDGSEVGEDFTFGRGRHKCIGENFAIAMVTAMSQRLAARGASIDATGLHYRAMFGHKWPRGVTLTLTS